MSKDSLFEIALQDAVKSGFDEEILRLHRCEVDLRMEEELSKAQVNSLSRRILSMPEEAKNLLFGTYCFKMHPETIGDFFQITLPVGKIRRYKELLAVAIGIADDHRICETSFEKACILALDQYVAQEEYAAMSMASTRRSTRLERTVSRSIRWAIAACAFISVGLGVTLTSNAEIRRRIVEWYMRHFSTYSAVQTNSDEEITIEMIRRLTPGFIPERYHFVEKTELAFETNYVFQDDSLNNLDITFQLPGIESFIDTEGLVVEEILWNEQKAVFMTDGDGYGTLAFSLDGVPVYVSGYLTKEEMLAIANGIE